MSSTANCYFVVVKFYKDEGTPTELVPDTWIPFDGSPLEVRRKLRCYWPPAYYVQNDARYLKLVKGGELPLLPESEGWRGPYPVEILYVTADYEKAKMKARKSQQTSELEDSESPANKKRERKPAKPYTGTTDEDDEDDEVPTPKKKKPQSLSLRSSSDDEPMSPRRSPRKHESPRDRSSNSARRRLERPAQSPSTSKSPAARPLVGMPKPDTATSPNPGDAMFKQKVLSLLETLRDEVRRERAEDRKIMKKILGMVTSLKREAAPDIAVSADVRDLMPAKAEADLNQLNHLLVDGDTFDATRTYLSTIGGGSLDDAVWGVMRQLIGDQLAQETSWTGKRTSGTKQKSAFSTKANLVRLVNVTMRKNAALKSPTDIQIKSSVKRWLAGAADRNGGRARRAAKTAANGAPPAVDVNNNTEGED